MNRNIMQRQMFAKGGAAFPDLSGDGRVTRKDILMGRGVPMQEGGDPQMAQLQAQADAMGITLRELLAIMTNDSIFQSEAARRELKGIGEAMGASTAMMAAPMPQGPPEAARLGISKEQRLELLNQQQASALNALRENPRMPVAEQGNLARLGPGERIVSVEDGSVIASGIPVMEFNRLSQADQERLTGLMPSQEGPKGLPKQVFDSLSSEVQNQILGMTQEPVGMAMGGDPAMAQGVGSMMPPPPAMPPAQGPMGNEEVMDPEVVEGMLIQAQENIGNIDEAEDYETVINAIRGEEAPISARYEELAEIVGEEDAAQTPESVLTLVQPAIVMGAVDQGIGGLAAEEMSEPVQGAMAQGIMSTVAPPPQPAAPGPEMMDPAMMGAGQQPPVNFNQGGLVRRGDNQPVQYFNQGGETLADFQKMLGLNVTSPQNLSQASSLAGTIPAYEPTYDERVLAAAKGAEARYVNAGLGSAESRAADLEEQKRMTQAQILFDVANTALAFSGPMENERKGLSPAERLALAAQKTQLLPTIGARAQQQLEYKRAAGKEERALKLAAVQRGETQVDANIAAEQALAVKKAEMAGKRYTMQPDDVLTDVNGRVLFEGEGGTINIPEGGTVINKKTGAVVATGSDKLYNLSPGTKLVDANGATMAEGKGQTVNVAPGTKVVNIDTKEVIAEGILPAVKGIPRDVWNTLSAKAQQSIVDNPSVNGVPASIFTQLSRDDQNIILKITSNNVKGIPRPIYDALSEEDQRKVMLGAESREERIKDIPVSVFNKLPEAVRNNILGATQVLSSDQRIVSVEDGSVIAEAAPKPIYKTVNNQLVVIDPKTNGVTPLFGTAELPEADYMQLTVNGVTTVVDKNTQKGRDALTAANALNAKTPGSAQFNTISSAQKPPTPKGFLVRNEEGDRVGIFTSYDGKSYVNEEGKIVPLDSNDVPVSDTITYDVLKGESVRTNANDQLIELDEKIISSLTDDKGNALAGGAREEVRNALKQARLGTGFWSSVYAGIDNVLGGVVAPEYFAETFQNTQDARQFTRMVGILGRSALAASPRFAVADLNLTMTLFPDPASFLANPVTEARKLIPLSQELSNEKRRILTAIRDVPDMPSTQKATLNQKLYEINRLTELLGPVLSLNTMQTSTSIRPAIDEAAALQSEAVKAGKNN
jgi:hypothetical protein